MYSRKKIPAPFGKPQKTAEKKKEATTAFSQKETSKEPIFLHAEEKTMPQGGGSPVLALLLRENTSASSCGAGGNAVSCGAPSSLCSLCIRRSIFAASCPSSPINAESISICFCSATALPPFFFLK